MREKRAEADGRRGASKASDSKLGNFAGSGFSTFQTCLKLWFGGVRTLFVIFFGGGVILFRRDYLRLPLGSCYALVNRRRRRSLEVRCRPPAACPLRFFNTGRHLPSNPEHRI